MAKFWKINKRDYYWTALELKNIIPELRKCDTDHIVSYLRKSGIHLVEEKLVKTPIWIRFTLPFALITLLLLLCTLPIKFMISGSWGYQNEKLSNWFKAVGF